MSDLQYGIVDDGEDVRHHCRTEISMSRRRRRAVAAPDRLLSHKRRRGCGWPGLRFDGCGRSTTWRTSTSRCRHAHIPHTPPAAIADRPPPPIALQDTKVTGAFWFRGHIDRVCTLPSAAPPMHHRLTAALPGRLRRKSCSCVGRGSQADFWCGAPSPLASHSAHPPAGAAEGRLWLVQAFRAQLHVEDQGGGGAQHDRVPAEPRGERRRQAVCQLAVSRRRRGPPAAAVRPERQRRLCWLSGQPRSPAGSGSGASLRSARTLPWLRRSMQRGVRGRDGTPHGR